MGEAGFPGGSVVKNPHAVQETRIQSLGGDDPLEQETAVHSSILIWETPRRGACGRQSMDQAKEVSKT